MQGSDWSIEFETTVRQHLPLLRAGVPVPSDQNLVELGLDSLNLIELLVALEDALAVQLPDALLTAETFATASTLWGAFGSPVSETP